MAVIPIEKERRALRLLAGGRHTERQIAATVGISRGSVAMLKKLGHERPRPAKGSGMLEARPKGPVERCPGCRRLIEMPCLACEAEAYRSARPARRFPSTSASADDLGSKLEGDERGRLESLRPGKIAEEESRPTPNDERLAPIEERRLDLEELRRQRKEELRHERVRAMFEVG